VRTEHGIPLAVKHRHSSTIRYRRSPFVVGYWRGAKLVADNYATGAITEIAPELWHALHLCTDWRSVDEIRVALGVSSLRAADFVRALTASGLLQRSDRPEDPRDRAMAAIAEWNPAAGFFHTATRRVRFLAPAAAKRLMRRRGALRPMPPPVKRLRGAATVRLPRPLDGSEFSRVLIERRTWRRFGSAPVPLQKLATALALTAGVQQWIPTEFGRLPLKTSPSGGARHPIELYVCAQNVAGLRAGLYHYAADVHRLERLRLGDMTSRLRAWMPHSEYFAKAAFAVILTAVLDREVWRYPYSRAYRAALAEAGHVCQTFCLTATWLGLAPFCLMGLDDAAIEKELGIDGVSETVLYVAGAGTRPRGTVWAPRPSGTLPTKTNPYLRPG
jgi:SagB-type dehydrogenase family enzyme